MADNNGLSSSLDLARAPAILYKKQIHEHLLAGIETSPSNYLLPPVAKKDKPDLFEKVATRSSISKKPRSDMLVLATDHEGLMERCSVILQDKILGVAQRCGIAADKNPVSIHVINKKEFRVHLAHMDKEIIESSSNRISRFFCRVVLWVKHWHQARNAGIVFLDSPFGVYVVSENVKKWNESRKCFELGQASLQALVCRAYSSHFYFPLKTIMLDQHASNGHKKLAVCMQQWEELFMRHSAGQLADVLNMDVKDDVPKFSYQNKAKKMNLYGNARVWPNRTSLTAEQMRLLFVCPELTRLIYEKNGVVKLPSSMSEEVDGKAVEDLCRSLNPSEKLPQYDFEGD